MDEVEGADFFLFHMSAYSAILRWKRECLAHQRLVLGPRANGEGECLCGNVHEAGFFNPVLNLRPMKGLVGTRWSVERFDFLPRVRFYAKFPQSIRNHVRPLPDD